LTAFRIFDLHTAREEREVKKLQAAAARCARRSFTSVGDASHGGGADNALLRAAAGSAPAAFAEQSSPAAAAQSPSTKVNSFTTQI